MSRAKIIPLFPMEECGPSQGFAEWYAAYPRRVARADALKAFMQQLQRGFTAIDMIQGAERFACMCRQKGTERDFIPHPATWLHGERWLDEELLEFVPPTQKEIDAAKDKADRLLRRGKYRAGEGA